MFQILNKTGEEKVKWGWAVYDWANNVYSLVITTAIFPIFYIGITSTTDKENCETSHIVEFFGWEFINTELSSYILALSFVAVIILSPLLSGMADFAGKKKLFLRLFCYTGSAGCVGLYWFDPNHLELSMIPFFMASIGFWGSVGFYNAYLPEIAPREEHDKLSARGYAMGYWSSLIILVICAVLITGVGKYLDFKFYIGAGVHMELVQTITRCCFVLVGFWWFGFAHITFNALPESEKKDLPTGNILFQGFKELRGVARELKGTKHLTRYLFAFFIMSMAIQTIMLMASSFGKKVIKLETTELIIIIFIVNLLAIPGAFGVSALSKRIGNIRALVACIIGWAAVCLGAYFFAKDETDTIGFYAVACGIGFLMGGTQSLNRATYSKILPDTDDPASYFSFYEMLEKGGLIIGMFGWGFIEGFTGTMHNSVLAMLVLFTLAYLAMMLVPKEYRIKVDYK
ncbi:MAG: MFS transporter [Crocinitomicaceae bacterium]|nr:MFS transporter [Crocinitomicaceae bacterium]